MVPEPGPARDLILPEPPNPPYLDKLSLNLALLLRDKFGGNAPVAGSDSVVHAHGNGHRLAASLEKSRPGHVAGRASGPIVTLFTQAAHAQRLAALSLVTNIRLPQASFRLAGATALLPTDNQQVLEKSGLARLHKQGKRGKLTIAGTIHYPKAKERKLRLAIVDDDFTGVGQLIQAKKLPADTRLVDLSIQNFPDLVPARRTRIPSNSATAPNALAALLAAPDVQLTLVPSIPRSRIRFRRWLATSTANR